MMQDLLRVAIFNVDPEGFGSAMVSLIPNEGLVGPQVELNTNQGACDRLDVGFKFEAGGLMDLVQDRLPHLREVYDLTYLLRVHVIEVLPLELGFLLDFSGNVLKVKHLSELSKRCHGAPKTFLDHLAHA